MIEDIHQTTGHGIRPICATLQVPRSSYYHAAEPTAPDAPTSRSAASSKPFSSNTVVATAIRGSGKNSPTGRVRRIMRECGLKAIKPKNYVPKTSDGRADKPSPNLLLDQPLPDKPDQVWAGGEV
ncbi:MAG: hypothetical protein ABIS50_04520 [Luteolibacter sp.]|uniref:hypothetical protein n=1 Tax=Luteolibacter sp. TaxID=1962973 RepID=UPI0032664294